MTIGAQARADLGATPRAETLAETKSYLLERAIHSGSTSTMLAHRALVRGIDFAPDRQQRLSVRHQGRRVWFNGARSNLNGVLAKRCTLFKDVTSRLLRTYGVDAPENMVFRADEPDLAWSWAQRRLPVVVKPNSGDGGRQIHLDIRDADEFSEAFRDVAASDGDALVERFIRGVEHRVLMIFGQVAAAARRAPAHVVGDGSSTVAALVEEKNRARREADNPAHWEIPVDELTTRTLAQHGWEWSTVPDDGRHVPLRANSNVHSGGDGIDATDELTSAEIGLAERTVRSIPGLRLAGLDLLLPRNPDGSPGPGEPMVLEINASPMMIGHHYPWVGSPRDVTGMLLDAMFPEKALDPR
ncbi:hypothetical protein [Nesterenkonia marinintestina]|uniref:hypothetical protein n=1 Tax=Nesterenkonia marinintestina TaxID=2979865 RepID=UPI0021BE32C5|nr:hypothetical protein [Nesterenkonia sp. GX14115]